MSPQIMRSAIRRCLSLFATSVLAVTASAAEPSPWIVRSYDTEHGLPAARVLSIGQNSDGYLWVGTNGGLARFDGVRFTSIPSLPEKIPGDANVTALESGLGGRLYFSLVDGRMGEVVGRELRVQTAANTDGQVTCLLPSPSGEAWLGQLSGGLVRITSTGRKVFGEAEGVSSGTVTELIRDAADTPWALVGNHLLEWKDEKWTAPPANSPAAQSVDAIAPARAGGIWLATASSKRGGASSRPGIWRKMGEDMERYSDLPAEDPGYYAERIAVLLEDRQGRLWCAVRGGGLFCQSAAGAWQAVGSRDMLARITSLYEDRDGVLWASTEATGLCRIAPRLVSELRAPAEIAQPVFWTVCATRDGAIWGGTDGAGLFCWTSDGRTEVYNTTNGLRSGQVPCLLEDRAGTLWAGTRSGLFQFRDGKFVAPPGGDLALRTRITALHEAPDGTLWAGTERGLAALRGDKVTIYSTAVGLPGDRVRSLQTGADGVIYVAVHDRGFFRQKPDGSFEKLGQNWEQGASARSIYADPSGDLWFTTAGRWLHRFRNEALERLAGEHGVPNHNVQGALADAKGNVWFASDLGIFGAPATTLRTFNFGSGEQINFWTLLSAQGMPNKACTGIGAPVGSLARDGRVWFANGSALAGVNPELLPASDRVSAPIFEGCGTAGTAPEVSADGSFLIRNRAVPLDLHFTSPETFFPERLCFRVQLEGRDAGWVRVGQRRSVSYAELPPGRYRFRVAVSAPGGDWIEAAAIPPIEIVPYFFERRSTRAALVALAVFLVALTAWLLERARTRRRLALAATQRALDAERQRIARDLHDELGAGLTDIMFAGDHLAEDLKGSPQLRPDAERISERARELARSIEEVVWSVDPAEDTLASFLLRFQRTAQEHLVHAGVQFRWDAPIDVPPVQLPVRVRHALLMAGKETITNALKHAGAREVRVKVRFDEPHDGFSLTIEDDGRGFDVKAPPHRGYGLDGVHARLAECGGTCHIETSPGTGTSVRFNIPSPALVPA